MIDKRIISLIKYSKHLNHRCCSALIGENTSKQICNIHDIWVANTSFPITNIIWCHKKSVAVQIDDEKTKEFIKSKDIQFINYNEGEKILGQTVDLLILQNFESLTSNLIAMSIETVKGGGAVVLLLDTINTMDSLIKIKPEFLINEEFVPRYNKRLFKSLINSKFTIFCDQSLRVLSFTKYNSEQEKFSENTIKKLNSNNDILDEDKLLIRMAKTEDQSRIIKEFLNVVKDRTERIIYSLQAGRGRGKSVALGIGVTKAI